MGDVNVTQADRDAAEPFMGRMEGWYLGKDRFEDLLVQAFARHRLSAQTPEPATQQPRADVVDDAPEAGLAEHFPSGLRSTRHILPQTGEVFGSPIQCECHCGASFAGTDEQEVRQLWAAHASAAALRTQAPASDEVQQALKKARAYIAAGDSGHSDTSEILDEIDAALGAKP